MGKTQNCIVGLLQIFIATLFIAGLMIFLLGRAFISEGVVKLNWGRPAAPVLLPTETGVSPLAFKVANNRAVATPAQAKNRTPTATDPAGAFLSPTPTHLPLPVAPAVTATVAAHPVNPPAGPGPTAPAKTPDVAPAEQSATRLVIPALGVDAPVLPAPIVGDTWQVDHLEQQIGHLERTAGPGESTGNMVLAGHVTLAPDGRPGPFINLSTLVAGDTLIIQHHRQAFTYRIDHLSTVKPTDVSVTLPTAEARLTLITCLNYDRAAGKYADRLVVVAYLVAGPNG